MLKIAKYLLVTAFLSSSLVGCGSSPNTPQVQVSVTQSNWTPLIKAQSTFAEQATVIAIMNALRGAGWIPVAILGTVATQVFLENIRSTLVSWYSDALFDGSGDEYIIGRILNQQDIRGIADLYVDVQNLSDVDAIRAALNSPTEFVRRLREDIVPRYIYGAHSSNPNSNACCSDLTNPTGDVPAPPSETYPGDPAESPVPGFTDWRGPQPVGGPVGNWVNPQTGDSLHPDLEHAPPTGPHWDWKIKDGPRRGDYRWFPDGTIVKKL